MKTRLLNIWQLLRASYWFIPSLMAVAAIILALVTQQLDQAYKIDLATKYPGIFSGGSEGARAVLSTIAGSILTVTGVTFSILIVALSNVSSQFGPRLLRSFMRDTGSQVVLGAFIGTFLFCLLALRTVRTADNAIFVPHISVTVGLSLAVVDIGIFIYFIHHSANLIHVSNVISRIGNELQDSIASIFPEGVGEALDDEERRDSIQLSRSGLSVVPDGDYETIEALRIGYIQAVDTDLLMQLARQHDLVIRIVDHADSFVIQGSVLAHIWPSGHDREALTKKLNEAFYLGHRRTATQEIGLFFDELIEIALRALSPGINDPYTALTCIDWITGGLSMMGERKQPSSYRYDSSGALRVIASPVRFEDVVNSVFDQIREAGSDHAPVLLKLISATITIAPCTRFAQQREVLLQQIGIIERDVRNSSFSDATKRLVTERYRAAIKALNTPRELSSSAAEPNV